MIVSAILQLYNELEKGNLVRCLENCKQWADHIYIYDDCSTDGSQEIYLQYTPENNIIFGRERNFKRELFDKQELLELAKSSSPDWIFWQDGDAILDRDLTLNLKQILAQIPERVQGAYLHYINIWRSSSFHRVDNLFGEGNFLVLWRNENLEYLPQEGLHLPQFPSSIDINKLAVLPYNILHYGFSSKEQIVRKYLTYKSLGQEGNDLERLIDEYSSFDLVKIPVECFPEENIPKNYLTENKPHPIVYDKYRKFRSYEEYLG